MIPIARATADRLIYDVANLRHIASILPPLTLERKVPGSGWTVRQVFGHLGHALVRHAAILDSHLAGEQALPAGFDVDTANAEGVAAVGTRTIDDLLVGLSEARDELIVRLRRLEAGGPEQVVLGRPLDEVLAEFASHTAVHSLELTAALAEIRFDPLVLNWLLYSDVDEHAGALLRQRRLLEDAQVHYAAMKEG